MSLTSYKKFIITLLLLAFSSQLMATAAMTCELEKLAQPIMENVNAQAQMQMHHHMSDMPMHDMAAMDDITHSPQPNAHQQFDCCKTMGHCLYGACSLAAINNIESFLFTKSRSTLVDFYSSITPSPIISSLYRPPIFC